VTDASGPEEGDGVFIVAHRERPEAADLAVAATAWLAERGIPAWMSADDAVALGLDQLADDRPAGSASLAISLGGDGTMLRTVQMLGGAPVSVLGVNVGLLGYLAEVEPGGLIDAIARWAEGPTAGRWRIEERMMLGVTVHRHRPGGRVGSWSALNEAVVEKQSPGHTVRLLVSIDGAPFTSYAADGLIIATPTGSTAYSLSARGPVVSPTLRALLLTPVSPHMLFDRSLVLNPDERIDVELIGHRRAILSLDGQEVTELGEGDVASITAAASTARFVRFGERRFHQILKSKFGLTDR
jgi:NAD+ kinase